MATAVARPDRAGERGALELVGEAFNLLRASSPADLARYYAGTLPFLLGALYFWTEMTRSVRAPERVLAASLALAGLFVWMKSWQSVFMEGLLARVEGRAPAAWPPRRLLRLALVQSAIQGPSLLLLPAALFFVVPFGALYAATQEASLAGAAPGQGLGEVIRGAWRRALPWQRQNHLLIWLVSPWVLAVGLACCFTAGWLVVRSTPDLAAAQNQVWFLVALVLLVLFVFPFSPFGCIVAGNIAVAVALLPRLLHDLLGWGTAFELSGWHSLFNATFLLGVYGLAHLCLDPLCRAAYVLRSFYLDARASGADLRVEVRRFLP